MFAYPSGDHSSVLLQNDKALTDKMTDQMVKIDFNKPFIVGKELFNIAQAVITYAHLAGDGHYTRLCQAWLEQHLACQKALLTHSCTAALEMAAILCDIAPGDEIIMPSYTFVSTANAFVLRGGVPVFVDIRPDTLNMDETLIEAAITSRTRAIVPVHYAGAPCAMDEIMDIATRYRLFVIEDAAQALLSTYKGKCLGVIGDFGAISFHETKNIISGEGGALMINREQYIERSEIIWEKGTNRKQFFRGEVDKYNWVDIGSSFLPGELTAAFLHAQLEQAPQINAKRRHIFQCYYQGLLPLADQNYIRLPIIDPEIGEHNGHLFYIIVKTPDERTRLIQFLKNQSIHTIFHYIPLHSSPAGRKYGKTTGDMKHTDDISERLIRLPLYYEMTEGDVGRIVELIVKYYK
jgi:dTDP-4-amino-4,6-dideoxygalactose transaminase